MLDKLGVFGLVGVLMLFAGIGLAAWYDLILGGALALVVSGLGLVVYGMISNFIQAMGMGQMMG